MITILEKNEVGDVIKVGRGDETFAIGDSVFMNEYGPCGLMQSNSTSIIERFEFCIAGLMACGFRLQHNIGMLEKDYPSYFKMRDGQIMGPRGIVEKWD